MTTNKASDNGQNTQAFSLTSHPSCILLRTVLNKIDGPILIGIAGDSGSGKTTFSDGIRRLLGKDLVKTITLDGYHTENRQKRQQTGHSPLDPVINNLKLLKTHLELLKKQKEIELPIYNHQTGDFDRPQNFSPSPIIIIEGLHALYPDFLPFYDFTIYVDPCRDIKWEWKYERDMKKRGHRAEKLVKEMLRREAAYKRWIDFQKTEADIVIKIFPSRLKEFSRYEFLAHLPKYCYKIELIVEPSSVPLPSLYLPFDLSNMLDIKKPPFLLATVPSKYWGRDIMDIHIDGVLSQKTISALEKHITSCTGISVNQALQKEYYPSYDTNDHVTATQFAQLLIAWRFLEQITYKYTKKSKS